MKVRVLEGVTADSPYSHLYTVKDGTSIVFLEPAIFSREVHARFYDDHDELHQVPTKQLLEVAP